MESVPPHLHHHHGSGAPAPASPRAVRLLVALTLAQLLATVIGMIRLWPSAEDAPERTALLAPGVEVQVATVTEVPAAPDPAVSVQVSAIGTSEATAGEQILVEITPELVGSVHVGDDLRVLSVAQEGAEPAEGGSAVCYSFDHARSVPLVVLFVIQLLLVAVVARGAGLRAVLGLAAGVAIVVWFLLPAIVTGQPPVQVALVAGAAMIFPRGYFAHGIPVRTTTAVLGTVGGVLVTVLGALNDVTITQASAAWELRAAMPQASQRQVFRSAMRIGRDHIAPTVYTLACAYIGSALPTLLFASTIERSLTITLTAGEIAAEVFRTLVASIGLVLAIPLTTAIAAWLASGTPSDAIEDGDAAPPLRGRRARV
ncbi:YibE/F family protein [Brachybacterium squillarum]|uniref:YibE/F family protein n=1 Tax=Brachybacterium squillarum TaxID=661979 RepID=UPI0002629945|nr:YibE/F family protein [Brachybacterium squillarum]